MAIPKRHWYHNSKQCKDQHYTGVLSAREFAASAADDASYCRKCYSAAVKAIPAEDAKPKRHNGHCTWPGCRSFAINPGHQGRDETSDLSLCDVCYWRKRATVRPIAEAPKDGTELLAWISPDEECSEGWALVYWSPINGWTDASGYSLDFVRSGSSSKIGALR